MRWLMYLKWYDAIRNAVTGQFAYAPFAGPFATWPYRITRYLETLRDVYIEYLKEPKRG